MSWLERLKAVEQAPDKLQNPPPEDDLKQLRLVQFTNKGLILNQAKEVAQRLDLRSSLDDRILCYECDHLKGYVGSWRCGNWRLAGIGIKESHAGLPNEMVDLPQRCNGFKKPVKKVSEGYQKVRRCSY